MVIKKLEYLLTKVKIKEYRIKRLSSIDTMIRNLVAVNL